MEIEITHNGHEYLIEYYASIENYGRCDGDRDTPPSEWGDETIEIVSVGIFDNDLELIPVSYKKELWEDVTRNVANNHDFYEQWQNAKHNG